jgi:hypothetical protein
MSQTSVMPSGEPIVVVEDDELIAMHPTNIAFGVTVVMPAIGPDCALGPEPVALDATSRTALLLTPE